MTIREILNYQPNELKFGTSGLRALVTDMTDLECYINTAGFLKFLKDIDQLEDDDGIVYLAGDLRGSTQRILHAVNKAAKDEGCEVVYCGLIPTPAIAFYASERNAPCIMVTGSHIPDDRNGIKFYKTDGEVLKSDEQAIKKAVAEVRQAVYLQGADEAPFDENGMLTEACALPPEEREAADMYIQRYVTVFEGALKGEKVVFYQHSTVGRDLLVDILQAIGAEVMPVGRSDKFVPIDTENVTLEDQTYFKELAREYTDAFAIVSTDGDSDRPFVVDEKGIFNRGDVLGAVVAKWLKADFAAMPVSCSDAVTAELKDSEVDFDLTKIGSPYVIVAMQKALDSGKNRVVGWEVNGGFLLGNDIEVNDETLKKLATRDALLPIIIALIAAKENGESVSELFAKLPQRGTQQGLLDNFPLEISSKIVDGFGHDTAEVRMQLKKFFTDEDGFGDITEINNLDGIRIFFDSGDIAHIRPSGNAPQLRIYSVANNQERADEIVEKALADNGILRKIEKFYS